jgi:hypothetical protein
MMSQQDKLKQRLLKKPKDFTWQELRKVLFSFGYEEIAQGKTGGSRRRFIHPTHPTITLHKPHPTPILKQYQLEQIIELLKTEKLL